MANIRLAATLAGLMCLVSFLAYVVTPSEKARESGQGIQLEAVIPKTFGPWREESAHAVQVVDPQRQQLLDKLYSQTLTRVYVDPHGYRVMLSLAYGDDQRGGLQAHMPEICYPAQGFTLNRNDAAQIATRFGTISGRRLGTRMGERVEPVTYWFAVADRVVTNKFEQRMAQIRIGLTGLLPYGLLFRVSSIDVDADRAYREQERFVSDLLAAVSPQDRTRLSGLAAAN